jgi:hypothetical protein
VIANVPEGLPATVTSCLTISARRLADRRVFVKRLDVIETLGCERGDDDDDDDEEEEDGGDGVEDKDENDDEDGGGDDDDDDDG